jgi:hypothetical protein
VDQGSDIVGVEMWHEQVSKRCYAEGIYIFHDPSAFVRSYHKVLEIGSEVRDEVISQRSEIWAAKGRRHVGAYTPFNVDGMRGGTQAHWFLSARFLSALLLAMSKQGGITEIVFGQIAKETPTEMARRLRKDRVFGLGWTMGDKACDLFAKWAIGTYRLCEGLDPAWSAADAPIPMDQRIGRLFTRFGFLDEFFGVVRMMSKKTYGFTPPSLVTRPDASDDEMPSGRWHLTVKDFRVFGKVTSEVHLRWLNSEWDRLSGSGRRPEWTPQPVLSILCRSLNDQFQSYVTPVEVDDYLMGLGGSVCTDEDPNCGECDLSVACQANMDPTRLGLKRCYT